MNWALGRYRQSVLDFVSAAGLGGVETDGQFEGIPCYDTTGDHEHNGIAGGFHYQLEATLAFNRALKALGAYQTGADAYAYSGANKWNHADTDAFGQLALWEQQTVGRLSVRLLRLSARLLRLICTLIAIIRTLIASIRTLTAIIRTLIAIIRA